ncbi:glycoside hydrolase [Hortaea werneckii]|nr:glycoside hydrolase [Hortaea werneckii]KAI7211901.1 glycoside hydrolase [Hortaea werneckii]
MHIPTLVAAASALATVSAQYTGFNSGNRFTDGSFKQQSDFEAEFNKAKSLAGTNGEFTSVRLFTTIQGGTANTPISAIPAAIDTQTSILLGLWASAGQANFDNEVIALQSAIEQYGSAFVDLIAGISVGSEDLYRISPTGIENDSGLGAQPQELVSYINQVRDAIAGTAASSKTIGHVDTWTAWVNGSNSAVTEACDWLGMDAYPYFQTTIDNSIDVANSTFYEALDATEGASMGKPVWVTETGWPVIGETLNQAVAGTENAEIYWSEVACSLIGNRNVWWYILQDAAPTAPATSFGVVGADLSAAPLYDLSCPSNSGAASSSATSATSSPTSMASSATAPASSAEGASSADITNATPGPQTSPSSVSISQSTGSVAATSGGNVPSNQPGSGSQGSAVESSMKASSTAPAATSSAMTQVSSMAPVASSTVMTKGGKTYTTYQTTMLTVTSCPEVCTTTVAPSQGGNSMAESAYGSAGVWSSKESAPMSKPATTGTVGTASPSPAATSATTPAAPSGSGCPANLDGEYQYPHLIVPVSSENKDKAYGTSYNGTISPSVSSIFNFDLPQSYEGQTCSLVFLFTEQDQLETSAFTFNGKGGVTVNELSSPATEQTTYNSVPEAAVEGIGAISEVRPGNSYVVASHECNAGARQSFEFMSTGGLDLEFFQDYNPSPIGAYITVC